MAAKKESPADVRGLRALRDDLAAAGPRPVYLLTGEDRLELDGAVEALREACVPHELQGFNVARLRGLDDSPEDVVAACEMLPMLGDRRFVLVREPERFKGEMDRLTAYCKRPCASTTLVLAPAQLDRRLGWVKQVEQAAFKADFPPPQGKDLERFITDELKARGKSIDKAALAMLLDLVSAETIMLRNELEKLALGASSPAITVEDVGAALGRTRTIEVWSLTNAIEDGDREKALAALRRLEDDGAALPLLVATLDWCLGRLFATETPRGFFGRQSVLDRRREELRGHGERIYAHLREADRLVRTTGGTPDAALEKLILDLPSSSSGRRRTD